MEKEIQNISENNTKNKSNRHKKRLLTLLLLLTVTGVMLGTSTYAWFTSNKTVSVNDIKVNVAAQNGIQMSVDGTNWKTIIQTTDITSAKTTYSTAVNQLPATLKPVSTGKNIDSSGKMEMYLGAIESNEAGQNVLTATKSTETDGVSGDFVAFDLFVKVDADTTAYMTPTSGVSVSTGSTDLGIKNASRMGFVILGHADSGSALADIQSLNAGTSSVAKIWEPNYDVHTAAGVSNAYDVYGITTSQTGGSALAYNGVIAPITLGDNVLLNSSAADYFKAVTPDYKTTNAFADQFEFLTFTKGITKVRVYMWIEGQDVDCENAASGTDVTFRIQLTTIEPTAGE